MQTTRPLLLLLALVAATAILAYWALDSGPELSATEHQAFVDQYCADCHNAIDLAGDLDFAQVDLADPGAGRDTLEQVVRKLRVGMMPPADAASPPEEVRARIVSSLEATLDRIGADHADPGPALVRRLNRAEYANAIRDLLDLRIDSSALLPPDDAAYGFDNNAEALSTSPFLIEQYLSAAGKIAALAIGDPDTGPAGQTFRFRQDASQNVPIDGMPIGTVGGGAVDVVLPLDGEYRLDLRYFKSNLGAMKGLELENEVEIAVDGERIHSAVIGGRDDFNALMANITAGADAVEARSSTTAALTAGPHRISAGFVYRGALQSTVRLQPFIRSSHDILDATGHPHLEMLTITGPYNATGSGDTPSRQRIFQCRPQAPAAGQDATAVGPGASEIACARDILTRLAHQAYRGQSSPGDVDTLMAFFADGHRRNGFESGIQTAIERLLASPKFIFRIERDPAAMAAGSVHPVDDLELASRLSFFLWSSLPDESLLNLAATEELSDDAVLEQQVQRMLSDPKAAALVENFAGQWLYLRNLRAMVPKSDTFPNFDDNLRQGFLRETELFFEHIVQENRPVSELMTADYSFLNERVARHYGIGGVYGSHFRQVTLDDPARRGLLGKGSVLMVSSHTDRTSPVVRGKWVLENLLGTPPPAPPPDVPALEESTGEDGATLSLRERLVLHRDNPACSACHALMDPIGFALENFNAVGAWRDFEYGSDSSPINADGRLLDGTEVTGPVELRAALMARPDLFVATVVEKLMIYALGRGLVAADMPAVRKIVRDAAANDYRFGDLLLGIVHSTPMRLRMKPDPAI